ncbi:hypothetical protein GCM10027051_08570 [Niabella terrae]
MAIQTLTDLMLQPDKNLLKLKYRLPSITAYNRLEPRPRLENFDRSLRAEVRDPLWMLTRQWQMGELEGDDAGSAIDVRLMTRTRHVDRIALKDQQGRPYTEMIPLEVMTEREPVAYSLALRIQMGQYFLKLHRPDLKAAYLNQYRTAFAIAAGQETDFRGQTDGLNLYTATRKRCIDGKKIWDALQDGSFGSLVLIAGTDQADMDQITQQFQAWLERQYSQPQQLQDNAWQPEQLSYRVAVAAPQTQQRQKVLVADHYHSGSLDWYSFDEAPRSAAIELEPPQDPVELDSDTVISYLPSPTHFKGMPHPRFWQMEERMINFGGLNAKTTDHLLLLFAELGLVYGNDWLVIPHALAVNTVCEIRGLVVTDVFGERTLIEAAGRGSDKDWDRWNMFTLSNQSENGSYNDYLFLPASLSAVQESEPIETVNFTRDEMANMAWGIEDRIPDATNKGISGHDAADTTGVFPEPVAADSPAAIRYLLGNTVPENWIPFMPVHIPGSNQDIRFQRARMPKLGMPPRETIRAKGVLLTEVQPQYYINEEEIPYSGTLVNRSFQRTRWYDGKTYLWVGRRRQTGKGAGASKLAFDQILPAKLIRRIPIG